MVRQTDEIVRLKDGRVKVIPTSHTKRAILLRKRASPKYRNFKAHAKFDMEHKKIDQQRLKELFKPVDQRKKYPYPKFSERRLKEPAKLASRYIRKPNQKVRIFEDEDKFETWANGKRDRKEKEEYEVKMYLQTRQQALEKQLERENQRKQAKIAESAASSARVQKRRQEAAAAIKANPPKAKSEFEKRSVQYNGKLISAMVRVRRADGTPLPRDQINYEIIRIHKANSVMAELFGKVGK